MNTHPDATNHPLTETTPADPHHDSRPWEPLAPGDPLNVGDEVRREWGGVSTRGTVGVQHSDLQVYTAERRHLGHRGVGTWYVRRRRPAPDLARAVIDLTATVKRVEALAEGLEREADKLGDSGSGLAVHSGSVKGRVAARIRTVLDEGAR